MELTKKNTTAWSRIGSRATFGTVLYSIAEDKENLMMLCPDTSTSAGLDRFRKKFPEKYLEIGIAEQNLMGIAAGLASEGFDVVTSTFSPFQTLRCCEQIKVNLGYMKHKVIFVGLASGVVLGKLGYTHCSIEDLAIVRAIPNITVLSPADCGETAKALCAALEHDQSVYIRLTGGTPNPKVFAEDYDFNIGKAVEISHGQDVTLIATGSMVNTAIQAADSLKERGIDAGVLNMHTIKPIDINAINKAWRDTKRIVTIEEHNTIGGLGSAVAEVKSRLANTPPQIFFGFEDTYGNSGGYTEILQRAGLTPDNISQQVTQWWQSQT